MEFLDNLTPIDNIPTNKDTNDEIGNNSEMLPERHFELTTPVTSVVPHSEDENLTTQTKKINDTNKKTMMMNNTDQKTCTETNLDSNIPQKAIPDSGVEGKRDDSDTNEMTNSEENSMKANLLQHDDSKLPNFPYKSVKFQDKNESTKKSFLNTQVETPDDYEMVVERDGRFDVVTHGDINAMIDKMKKLHTNGLKSGKKSNKPQRKQIEPKSCKLQIPKQESELEQSSNSASSCTYASPYALTEKQKLAVKDRLRLYEEKMRKVIEEQKEMEKKKKEVNETAFEVWLKQTKEKEIAIRKQEKLQEMESIKKEEVAGKQTQREKVPKMYK
ncbi:coiled-coil domain-containing protein 181-like isoform X1 [Argonauta hians]